MKYAIELTDLALRQFEEWRKSGQTKVLEKISKLLDELTMHPTSGTGKVEQLKGNYSGYWSRRIDKGSRLIYRIEEHRIVVIIVSMKGHYDDK